MTFLLVLFNTGTEILSFVAETQKEGGNSSTTESLVPVHWLQGVSEGLMRATVRKQVHFNLVKRCAESVLSLICGLLLSSLRLVRLNRVTSVLYISLTFGGHSWQSSQLLA